MKKRLSNFFKVRRRIPSAENRSIGLKWACSHYALVLHGEAENIAPNATPSKDNIGECNSLFSLETYNEIKKITEDVNKVYYSETNAAYNTMQTEATCAMIQNSAVVYAMLCAIWRCQTGYLIEDVDGRKLSPVMFNHSWHHSNNSDWTAGGENFAIVRGEEDYQTQEQIQTPGVVPFAMGIANEPWNHFVQDTLKSIRLPKKVKQFIEHMCTTVFADPDAAYNPSFVIFHPASGWVDYSPTFNENNELTGLEATTRNLDGYDSYDENNGFDTPNGMSDVDDIRNYLAQFSTYVDRMLNTFPQITEVFEKLEYLGGSDFNFTRDLDHQTLLVIADENITDFIQTTAFAPFVDDEMGDYNEPLADMLHSAPVIVRDKERSYYAANLKYSKDIEIETDLSFELFSQGKIIPLQFAYLEYQQNDLNGDYVWCYLVPRELHDYDDNKQIMSVTLINSILNDGGAVVPIYNIVQTEMDSTTKGTYVSPRPTINSYYKTITEIGPMVEDAQTSFYKK